MNNLENVKSFLSSRRSFPPATLGAPYPSRAEIEDISRMGLRVPDHKKLEPWRLIGLEGEALKPLSILVQENVVRYQADTAKAAKITTLYENAGAVIVMVFAPKIDPVTPNWEQHLSMGAVGVSLVNAAISMGFGASWMTGFLPECPEIRAHLGIKEGEEISGFVHLGTPKSEPPERPRPQIEDKLTFL